MPAARWAGATGMVVGYVADHLLGDPRRAHPVALFGSAAQTLETAMWADSRSRGAVYSSICVAVPVVLGAAVEHGTRARPRARFVATAVATWSVLGMRGLAREAAVMSRLLETGDVPGARERLAHLCGRDADSLDAAALARATCESIAENTADAVVGALWWGAVAGIPGLLGYRALNTLDAMVGHRDARYARFGWASARGDDLANLVPARLSAALTAVAALTVDGSPSRAWRTWRRDGHKHPSPNAGRVEAAFAGALGVRLGGTNTYGGTVDERGSLGDGRAPGHDDPRRAAKLSAALGWLALGVSASLALRRKC